MNVKIFGIGGCGRNLLNAMIDEGFPPENAVFIDTDINARPSIKSDSFIQLGKSLYNGLGTGNDPSGGRAAAELSRSEIVEAMRDADVIILTLGLAGGTGGGAAPFIASLAHGHIKVTALAVMPVEIEGKCRRENANSALSNLRAVLDKDNVHIIETSEGTISAILDTADRLAVKRIKEVLEAIG